MVQGICVHLALDKSHVVTGTYWKKAIYVMVVCKLLLPYTLAESF